jgi:protein-S-isoprenylcysteine O-methyltransferase Ste14
MAEKIVITLLSLTFLGIFITRNIVVKTKVKQRVRASSLILNASVIFTAMSIFAAIFSVYSDGIYRLMGILFYFKSPIVTYAGLTLFGISIAMGWFISAHLKESWRVGIHEDQKTELIIDGIYKYVRNPYFISYYFMFFSLFLVRPSIILLVLIAITITIFHRMVMNEERHLLELHGEKYMNYKETTGRYLPHLQARHSK